MPHTSTHTPNYPIFDTYKVSAPTGNASRSYSTKTCDFDHFQNTRTLKQIRVVKSVIFEKIEQMGFQVLGGVFGVL